MQRPCRGPRLDFKGTIRRFNPRVCLGIELCHLFGRVREDTGYLLGFRMELLLVRKSFKKFRAYTIAARNLLKRWIVLALRAMNVTL